MHDRTRAENVEETGTLSPSSLGGGVPQSLVSGLVSEEAWLDEFLPLMRCPDTHQPLRRATAEECAKKGLKAALATEDGSRLFVIDDGIPILLPMEKI